MDVGIGRVFELLRDEVAGIGGGQFLGPADGSGLYPGQYPYTRGPYASMYRSKLWTMRMFAGFGTAIDTIGRYKDILYVDGGTHTTAMGNADPLPG